MFFEIFLIVYFFLGYFMFILQNNLDALSKSKQISSDAPIIFYRIILLGRKNNIFFLVYGIKILLCINIIDI